jgi:hypothetical protein
MSESRLVTFSLGSTILVEAKGLCLGDSLRLRFGVFLTHVNFRVLRYLLRFSSVHVMLLEVGMSVLEVVRF